MPMRQKATPGNSGLVGGLVGSLDEGARSCRDEPGADWGPGGGNEGAGGGLCREGRCLSSTFIIPEGLAVVVVPAAGLLRLK
jgi:hypothetical protein